MFNNKFRIGVLKHPGYNGGGKGASSSSSSSRDFFGVGKRAPYEALLSDLLLGGPIGATEGYYMDAKGKKLSGFSKGATFVPGQAGVSLTDFIKQTPGYQFGMDQGMEALNRSFASTGTLGGNQAIALQNFGNQYAGQALQQLIGNVTGPAGVNMIGQTSTSQGASPLGGIFGTLAGAALSMGNPFGSASTMGATVSDRNLKTNIKHINTINGIKIYSFNYIWSYIKSIGVMAQDLLEMPQYKHAVHTTNIGYVVDYSKLPI